MAAQPERLKSPGREKRGPRERVVFALICAFLVLITVAIYGQATRFELISLDDETYVFGNPRVKAGLTADSVRWAFQIGGLPSHAGNWHPLTWISLMIDTTLYGAPTDAANPGSFRTPGAIEGYHLTNIVMHVLNTLLLFLLMARLTGRRWRSAFVAALFAVHPLHVESVAWVAERKDVLSTLFWLLTMLAYGWYARRPRGGTYAVVFVLFALGLMAKPMLVTLPLLLLVMDWWPLNRFGRFAAASVDQRAAGTGMFGSGRRGPVLEKLPLLVLTGISCGLTLLAQDAGGAIASTDVILLPLRIENAIMSYLIYLGKMVWPTDLSPLYLYKLHGWPSLYLAGSGLAFALFCGLALAAARKRPALTAGWLWYVVTLIPVIGIVQVGYQGWADRYTYVPLIGIFLALSTGIAEWARAQARRAVTAAVVVAGLALIGTLGWMAHTQAGRWHDGKRLYRYAIALPGGNWFAENALGQLLLKDHGRLVQQPGGAGSAGELAREALEHVRNALSAPTFIADIHNNLGIALRANGYREEAAREFREILKREPDNPQAGLNLGKTYVMMNRLEDALQVYRYAASRHPDDARAPFELAMVHDALGNGDEAAAQGYESVRLDPGNKENRFNLGVYLGKQKRYPEAIEQFRRVLQIDPTYSDARYFLAQMLASNNLFSEAASEHEALLAQPRLTPFFAYWGRLAYADLLVARKEKARAIAVLQQAVQIQQNSNVDPGKAAERNLGKYTTLQETKD